MLYFSFLLARIVAFSVGVLAILEETADRDILRRTSQKEVN
jgi:hypothetical protein